MTSRGRAPFAVLVAVGLVLGIAPNALAARRDTQRPSVTIETPSAGTPASGELSVVGAASDNRSVRQVSIAVDNGSFVPVSGTTQWSGAIDTTGYPNGTHILHAKAWDTHGNSRTTSISVTVSNGPSDASSAGPQSLTTPEGATIDVNTAGPWTADGIYQMLKDNGLDSTIGPALHVEVQDTYPSQVSTSTGNANGQPTFGATLYLQGVNSTFAATPDAVLGHEFGHVWTLYYLTMAKGGDWSSYLAARGLAGDPRLNSSYNWTPREIIADDYRLLFGSDAAISERPTHLNSDIPDPRDVAGLRDFLANNWTASGAG
jgi:hypothetical protein